MSLDQLCSTSYPMKNTAARAPRSRAPNGTGEAGRINFSLLPDERKELRRLADADGRTLSAMARVLVLRAISQTSPEGS